MFDPRSVLLAALLVGLSLAESNEEDYPARYLKLPECIASLVILPHIKQVSCPQKRSHSLDQSLIFRMDAFPDYGRAGVVPKCVFFLEENQRLAEYGSARRRWFPNRADGDGTKSSTETNSLPPTAASTAIAAFHSADHKISR